MATAIDKRTSEPPLSEAVAAARMYAVEAAQHKQGNPNGPLSRKERHGGAQSTADAGLAVSSRISLARNATKTTSRGIAHRPKPSLSIARTRSTNGQMSDEEQLPLATAFRVRPLLC